MTTTSPLNGSAGAGATMTSSATMPCAATAARTSARAAALDAEHGDDVDGRDGDAGLRRALEHHGRRVAQPPTRRDERRNADDPEDGRQPRHELVVREDQPRRQRKEHGPAHARERILENVRNAAPPSK